MDFPDLRRSNRDREYLSYSPATRAKVVYSYLFDGKSHRQLDEEVIGLDSSKSKGFQSMNILQFLGLRNEHKGFFKDNHIDRAINILEKSSTNDLSEVIGYLKSLLSFDYVEQELHRNIKKSRMDSSESRQQRLKSKKQKTPEKIEVSTYVFKRDPDVIVEVLNRAKGICEFRYKKAPFIKRKDGQPYLEVHHKVRLADGETRHS